jgi:uncharacterized membrane protein YdjX (TVP38/TMEM64 family)
MLQSVREYWWPPVILILVYGFGGLIALPAVPLTLVIGAVYGLGEGMIYNTLAANLGAAIDFLAARTLGRNFVQKLLKGKWKAFDEKAAVHGFRLSLYLRLVPLFPFLGINFAAGLSKISFRDDTAATIIGMLPGTFVYTYFASSLLAGAVEAKKEALFHLVLSSLLLILLSLIPIFRKRFKKT